MKKITSPMVAIGAILSLSIFAPTTVCAQQVSMQSPGLPQYSQTTGSYYQGGASAAAARAQQAYPQAYQYPATAPQANPAAAPQNYQAQQPYPAEQQGSPGQQGYPTQQGYPAQQGYPEQVYTTPERTYAQGAESPAYQDAQTPYEAQERAIQQAQSLNQGQSKIDTPAADAMTQQQQSPSSNISGRVAQTGMSSAMRTAGRVALVALPVTAIVLLTRTAATSAMPMMSPSMGMMRMGLGGVSNMRYGMSGMGGMGTPMGIGLSTLLNRLR